MIAPQALLPYAWDARMRKAVRATPGIGAAIPLCDIEASFALLDEEERAGAAGAMLRVDAIGDVDQRTRESMVGWAADHLEVRGG